MTHQPSDPSIWLGGSVDRPKSRCAWLDGGKKGEYICSSVHSSKKWNFNLKCNPSFPSELGDSSPRGTSPVQVVPPGSAGRQVIPPGSAGRSRGSREAARGSRDAARSRDVARPMPTATQGMSSHRIY